MAETPFSPGPAAADAAAAPEQGSQGIPEVAPGPEAGGAPPEAVEAVVVEAVVVPEQTVAVPEPPEVVDQPVSAAADQPPAPPQDPAAPAIPETAAMAGEVSAVVVPEPTLPTPALTEPPAEAALAAPAPAAAPAAEPPGVAATIEVPPLEGQAAEEGGEWELLLNRVTGWWNSGEFGRQWQRIRGPLKGVAILVAVLVALRAYATVVSTIDAIPLVSGLLELAGLITVLQFGATRLLRTGDREQVLAQWRRRWLDFRGRD